MNRSYVVRLVLHARSALGAGLACLSFSLFAQALEIIPLRHRTAEQVLPALQPLLEPGGTLSGTRNQLFLRASPANVAEIRRALDAIDRPLRRLLISVRLDNAAERERRAVGASGTVSNRGARVDVTAEDARRSAGERVDQRLQVLEGSRALIYTGESRPFNELASGFEVVPRLAGNEVVLDIVQGQQVSTVARVRVGEWVEIAGATAERSREARGIGSASAARGTESRRVWLKVEALD